MPTSKPRITVTLTDHQHAILRRISESGGMSMSGVISEFMIVAQPTLERMAATLQQLKQDRESDHQRIMEVLYELQSGREAGAKSTLATLDGMNLSADSGSNSLGQKHLANMNVQRVNAPGSRSPEARGEVAALGGKQKEKSSRRVGSSITDTKEISPRNRTKSRKKNVEI